jgi:hypothetical protein
VLVSTYHGLDSVSDIEQSRESVDVRSIHVLVHVLIDVLVPVISAVVSAADREAENERAAEPTKVEGRRIRPIQYHVAHGAVWPHQLHGRVARARATAAAAAASHVHRVL